MNELKNYEEKVFEDIKHIDEDGKEFWYARELMVVLDYSKWDNFKKVIESAKTSCERSNIIIDYHFAEVSKMINIAKGAKRKIIDYKLSRYACYLIVQNADPRKENVALGQTYFAVQTRKQEIFELEYNHLSEDDKRFYKRNLIKKENFSLNQTAKNSGVKNFDKFHNNGYKGLYNGETANDIAKRKHLRYREDILDNMSSEELVANLFRITQTEAKLKRDNVKTEGNANKTHYKVGQEVRNTIKRLGGTMPEELPTPKKSLKELQKEKNRINNKQTKQ